MKLKGIRTRFSAGVRHLINPAYSRQVWVEQQRKAEQLLPMDVQLEARHLQHCRVLPHRYAMLEQLPAGGVVAELGVDSGGFSQQIWDICNPSHLHLIDTWDSPRYNEDKAQQVARRFAPYMASGRVHIHRGYSTTRAADFEDNYFDWIYIDTDHSYTTTRDELRLYAPKVKPGGIIAGHDFIKGNWLHGYRYGVIEAVHAFCVAEHWEFLYLTMELNDHPSFAIRRIGVPGLQ